MTSSIIWPETGGFLYRYGIERWLMPLTKKGVKIKKKMAEHYGKERGKEVFYKSQQSGKIKGTHKK